MESNFCDLDSNRFIRIIAGNNDAIEAIRLIRICGRGGEILSNSSALRQLSDIYREELIALKYEELVEIFAKTYPYLAPLYEDSEFWLENMRLRNLVVYKDETIRDSLRVTISKGRIIYAYYMLKYYMLNDYELEDALISAVNMNNERAVKLILKDSEVDPNFDQGIPLRLAVQNGNAIIVTLLVNDERTDPNLGDSLMTLCQSGNMQLVRVILSSPKIQITRQHVEMAMQHGNIDVVIAFVESDQRNIKFVSKTLPLYRVQIINRLKSESLSDLGRSVLLKMLN